MSRTSINFLSIVIQSGFQLCVNRLLIGYAGLNILGLSSSLIAIATFARILDGTFSVIVCKYVASNIQSANKFDPSSFMPCILLASIFSGVLLVPVFAIAAILHVMPNQLLLSFHVAALMILWAISTSANTLLCAGFDALLWIKEKCIVQIIAAFIQLIAALILLPTNPSLDFTIIVLILPGLAGTILMLLIMRFTGNRLKSTNKARVLPAMLDLFGFVRASKDFQHITFSSIVLLGLEPTTKLFLLRLGGPSIVAVFDIANQYITKVRSIIISSMSYFLGIFASTDYIAARKIAKSQFLFLSLICLFPFGILIANTPFLSEIFYGQIIVTGKHLLVMAAMCWFINTCTGPAHNLAMASNSKLVLKSTIMMSTLNLLLGVATIMLGFNAIFAAAAYFLAITLGSFYLNIKVFEITGISSDILASIWKVANSYAIPGWIVFTLLSSCVIYYLTDNIIVSGLFIVFLQAAPAAFLSLRVLTDFKTNHDILWAR